jgi:hypothetical protein
MIEKNVHIQQHHESHVVASAGVHLSVGVLWSLNCEKMMFQETAKHHEQ